MRFRVRVIQPWLISASKLIAWLAPGLLTTEIGNHSNSGVWSFSQLIHCKQFKLITRIRGERGDEKSADKGRQSA